MDNSRQNLSSVYPIINGLSAYNVWILTIKNMYICNSEQSYFKAENQINKQWNSHELLDSTKK